MGEFYHFGIKGMHWGVRRYQNEDGSYNAAGKKRYVKLSESSKYKGLQKELGRTTDPARQKAIKRELKTADKIDRANSPGMRTARKVLTVAGVGMMGVSLLATHRYNKSLKMAKHMMQVTNQRTAFMNKQYASVVKKTNAQYSAERAARVAEKTAKPSISSSSGYTIRRGSGKRLLSDPVIFQGRKIRDLQGSPNVNIRNDYKIRRVKQRRNNTIRRPNTEFSKSANTAKNMGVKPLRNTKDIDKFFGY